LEARGHRYRTRCDTETILHAYEEFGADCVRRLRGMFALAIWDSRRRRLMLARDRAGKKRRVFGLYAALSYDEGQSWPVKKLVTPGGAAQKLSGGAWTGVFTLDRTHAEPRGYLAVTQTPDGTIHLISSALHYRFNKAWLEEPMPAASS